MSEILNSPRIGYSHLGPCSGEPPNSETAKGPGLIIVGCGEGEIWGDIAVRLCWAVVVIAASSGYSYMILSVIHCYVPGDTEQCLFRA